MTQARSERGRPKVHPRIESARAKANKSKPKPPAEGDGESGIETPIVKVPKMPRIFSPAKNNKVARAKWKETCTRLIEKRMLSITDLDTVQAYCMKYQEYEEIRIERGGKVTSTTSNGNLIQHPLLSAENKVYDQLQRLREQMGMTPKTRDKIDKTPPPA